MRLRFGGFSFGRLNLKEKRKMIEPKNRETMTLIRCENENCGGVCFEDELEQSDWKCPYCGEAISESE